MKADTAGKTTVAIRPGPALRARPRLFATLEDAFPVRFLEAGAAGDAAEATIAIGEEGEARADAPEGGKPAPTLALAGKNHAAARPERVRLSDCDSLDRRIRAISIDDPLDGPGLDPPSDAEEVLASCGSGPVWTKSRGVTPLYRVGSSLPELGPEQALRDLLAERPLALVALVHFLRSVTEAESFSPPALRAAILFDDPNLRWRTYGFIDYRKLLAHADAHRYHAAMAMIPLDGGRQHRATVELFRKRADRLSLVFHGNNHLSRELMRADNDDSAVALMAQALRRARRFESRYGLPMDRVMTPPHGMCSANVARALGRLGFDGLCAIHPLPWAEQPPAARPLAGWDPAEFAAGCAVIPRIHLDTGFSEVSLRAYLGQPLVIYGHHDDLSDGLDPLAVIAAAVNQLGDVQWMSLAGIAATNRATRLDGNILRVRPYSHRLRVTVPSEVSSIVVERPRGLDREPIGWATDGASQHPFDSPVPCAPGSFDFHLTPQTAIDPEAVPAPTPSIWPALRRAATETRDRLRPFMQVGTA